LRIGPTCQAAFENLNGFGQVGKTASGTVGEIAKVEVTPIAGGTDPEGTSGESHRFAMKGGGEK
jgi:hypothetical protein